MKETKELTILYENDHLLIINKPAGLVVHSDGKTKEPNICDWLLAHYPKIAGVGEPSRTPEGKMVDRPGIVHRLDRETSGVMVIAKTQAAFEYLKKEFQEHRVQKTYNAFVWGTVKEDKGTIDRQIGRSKNDFRKWSAERFARGELRDAVTEYKVLRRFASGEAASNAGDAVGEASRAAKDLSDRITYIEAYPKTGRTHQIRVHFKAINHPVVGDTLYGPKRPKGPAALGFERVALHARKIEFTDTDGSLVAIEAPLPADFQDALGAI